MFRHVSLLIALIVFQGTQVSIAADCKFDLDQFLKNSFKAPLKPQGRPGLVDFDAVVAGIEKGKYQLKRVPGQSVSEVIGLSPDQDVFIRQNFVENWYPGLGLETLGFEVITRQKRDVQFYKLSRYLGYDNVPETVLKKINGVEVSMTPRVHGQEFRTEKAYAKYIQNRISKGKISLLEHKQDLEDLAILDMVTGNMDRNVSNFIFDERRNRIIPIDHSDVMPPNKTPGLIWFWTMEGPGLNLPMSAASKVRIKSLNFNKLALAVEDDRLIEKSAIRQMGYRISFMKHFLKEHPHASIQELGQAMEDFMSE